MVSRMLVCFIFPLYECLFHAEMRMETFDLRSRCLMNAMASLSMYVYFA